MGFNNRMVLDVKLKNNSYNITENIAFSRVIQQSKFCLYFPRRAKVYR